MTMMITITNSEPGRWLRVVEETFSINEQVNLRPSVDLSFLDAGESRTFYLHKAKRLILSEG